VGAGDCVCRGSVCVCGGEGGHGEARARGAGGAWTGEHDRLACKRCSHESPPLVLLPHTPIAPGTEQPCVPLVVVVVLALSSPVCLWWWCCWH